jgi:glycosyltransferase involved in cell wall biosynthesis
MDKIDLSIIVPFYRGDQFIGRLLTSIQTAWMVNAKKEFSFELFLIIDSPESNESLLREKVAPYSLPNIETRVLKNDSNIGVASTRNRGLLESRGEYVYFIDQDDEVAPEFFIEIERAIANRYEFILINGLALYTNPKMKQHLLFYLAPHVNIKNLILDDIVRSPGQIVLKKGILKDIQFPIPKKNFGADDKFFWVIIFLSNPLLKVFYIDKPLYRAHIHEKNFSHQRSELFFSGLELWSMITSKYETSRIDKYIRRNIFYIKFVLRSHLQLTVREKFFGALEMVLYFIKPNRIIRYVRKHVA